MPQLPSRFAALAAMALAPAALADIPWSNPSGTANFFDWDNGRNTTGLFGSPTLVGNTFYFFPSGFVASSTNGGQVTATDTFKVDLIAHFNYKFDAISVSELGDWSILQGGSVDANATLDILDPIHNRNTTDSMVFNPAFPHVAPGTGTWTGEVHRDLTVLELGQPFTFLQLTFTNNLISITSSSGESALIRKTVVGVPVAVTIIPAPGVGAVLALAGLASLRRRRQR
jgi:hypothetical protein